MSEREFLDKDVKWEFVSHMSLSRSHNLVERADYGEFILLRCKMTPIKIPKTCDRRKGSIHYLIAQDRKQKACLTMESLISRLKELGFLH